MRRKFFKVDIQKLLNLKGKLCDNLTQCEGTAEKLLGLHGGLADCTAVVSIMRLKGITFEHLYSGS